MLLVLALKPDVEQQTAEVRQEAISHGLRIAKKLNVTAVLSKAEGYVVKNKSGWRLTDEGKVYLSKKGYVKHQEVHVVISDLRNELSKITHSETVSFVAEAIECFERQLYRAAVVLSWIGAVSLLYEEVIKKHLSAFNNEATRRDAKWRNANNADDIARMKEHSFLDILEALSIIGKNVKQELQSCLALRNGCGHPNSLKIGKQKVAAHLEVLMLNIFSKF